MGAGADLKSFDVDNSYGKKASFHARASDPRQCRLAEYYSNLSSCLPMGTNTGQCTVVCAAECLQEPMFFKTV